ncbi:hypothetical protein E0494_03090 [Marinilabiliaceae bacterium JC040]|nr:hypothetical protein [Marinilabiliaceae bacterium JC040]
MNKYILAIYLYLKKKKKLSISILFVLLFMMTISSLKLSFNEDISAFLPSTKRTQKISKVFSKISSSNNIFVFFKSKDSTNRVNNITSSIDKFENRLKKSDVYKDFVYSCFKIENKQQKILEYLSFNSPYYLSNNDYQRIDSLMQDKDYISKQMDLNRKLLMLPISSVISQTIIYDPLHLYTDIYKDLNSVKVPDLFVIKNGYLFTSDGSKGLVILKSDNSISESKSNNRIINELKGIINNLELDNDEVSMHLFGGPVIAVNNANQIKSDSIIASIISIVLILFLLLYFIGDIRNILLMFSSLIFGLLFALSVCYIVFGEISMIVVGIGSIFIGIAINYSLHFILHLKHNNNVFETLKDLSFPLIVGNLTTVGAFISLMFLSSSSMKSLGLYASMLLVGTILYTIFIIPLLVKIKPQAIFDKPECETKYAKYNFKKLLLIFIILGSPFMMYFSQFTSFDRDIHKINYLTEEQKADFNLLQNAFNTDKNSETIFVVASGNNIEEAAKIQDILNVKLNSLCCDSTIVKCGGVGRYLPSESKQKERIVLWNKLRDKLNNKLPLLKRVAVEHGFSEKLFTNFERQLNTDYSTKSFKEIDSSLMEIINPYICSDDEFHIINMISVPKDKLKKISSELNEIQGVLAFDNSDVSNKMVEMLLNNFNYVLWMCGFIVFMFLTISFGSIEISIIAFTPLLIGWIWILGIMHFCGLSFNIINVILATFIFGQGDDYTIFVTEGAIHEYTYRKKVLKSYRKSVVISSIIMFIGVGSLIISKHPALESLASLTMIGMSVVVIMSFLIPPFLFNLLVKRGEEYREKPITILRIIRAIRVGLIIITATSITNIYMKIYSFFIRENTRRKDLAHKILYRFACFSVRNIPGVKYKLLGKKDTLDFSIPKIYIANHQCHFDLMCVLMLSPKIVIVTNDWVWNNSFYGKLVRTADFFPVSSGIANNLDKFKEYVEDGYSVLIFPEGTRSPKGDILRFHKGAFYLSEELNIPIVPLLIHGANEILPKNELILNEGIMRMYVGEIINRDEDFFSHDLRKQAKEMRNRYINWINEINEEVHDLDYYLKYIKTQLKYKDIIRERNIYRLRKKLDVLELNIENQTNNDRVYIEDIQFGIFAYLYALRNKDSLVYCNNNDKDVESIISNFSIVPNNLIFVDIKPDNIHISYNILKSGEIQKKIHG